MNWIEPSRGVHFKAFNNKNQQIRMVEFSEGFTEPDWCMRGHAGYVLDGKFAIDYNSTLENYKKGDVIFIPEGEQAKHKVIINAEEKVTLLLFEMLNS